MHHFIIGLIISKIILKLKLLLNMLYHPQSGYYRQFLSVTAKQRNKKVEQVVNTHVTKNMPNINPGSVGL